MQITFKGIEALEKKFDQMLTMNAVRMIVELNGAELQRNMVSKAVFTKGYSTGQTRRSIPVGSGFRDGGLTTFAGPTTEYAPYVEYGTRKMSAQPFVKPAFNEQKVKFQADMKRLVSM